MGNKLTTTKQDKIFFTEIAAILHKARETAYKTVNTMMIQTNWQIGKRIVEQEQKGKSRADYGDYLIVNLSRYLTDTLGKGFSEANIRNFRQFYLIFPDGIQFATRRVANLENLSWSHWRLLMRLDDNAEREYYITDLKTTKLSPQDVGQMEMYVRMFDALKRGPDDNPTLGIILCAEKDETVVKYSVLKESKQIFASKYKTILPTEKQLAAMIEKKNARLLLGVNGEGK